MGLTELKRLEHLSLVVLDIISFGLVFVLVQWLRHSHVEVVVSDIPLIAFPLIVFLVVNYIFGLYSLEEDGCSFDSVQSSFLTLLSAVVSFFVIILCIYSLGVKGFVGKYFGRGVLLGLVVGFALLTAFCRFFIRRLFVQLSNRRCYLVLSDEDQFYSMVKENEKSLIKRRLEFCSLEQFENMDEASTHTFHNYVGLVVSGSVLENPSLTNKLMELRLRGVSVLMIHDFFEKVWCKIPLLDLKDRWFVASSGFGLIHHPVNQKLKRVGDIMLAMLLSLPTLCLFPFIAILIKLTSRGSVFYSQIRTGENGKNFVMYKFRSMIQNAEMGRPQWSQKDDLRITPVGIVLRRLRLDELPQIWNVLRGDMSFIGPRPERPEFNRKLAKSISYYNLRHLVRPGITGWAQVLHPYGSSMEDTVEKLQYELYYIKNYSLLLDLSIIAKTIKVVLLGRGK